MAINSTNRKAGPFIGNGAASVTADLEVASVYVATGVEATLMPDADYTAALNVNQGGFYPTGFLPLPAILEQYDRIVENGAERIFAQFEAQAVHHRKTESRETHCKIFVQIFGAISLLLLAVLAIGVGCYLVARGKSLEGFGPFFTGLAALVAHISLTKNQSDERNAKQRE